MNKFNQLQIALESIGFKKPLFQKTEEDVKEDDDYETHMQFETRQDRFI